MTGSYLREFRNALGQFATGVTVITTRDAENNPVGVTASSFNSVSLDPPLVLWSLDKSAASLPAFSGHGHFAVHVLAAGQEDISNNFAQRGEDKFAGVEYKEGIGDVPILSDCAAFFLCRLAYEYEGGDHVIFVGEVLEFVNFGRPPLVFHAGKYARAKSPAGKEINLESTVDFTSGSISSDFLGYLVSRAHYQFHLPLVKDVEALGMQEIQYFILSLLCIRNELYFDDITRFLLHTGLIPTIDHCKKMEELDLISLSAAENPLLRLSDKGKSTYIELLAADMARQQDALSDFSTEEVAEFVGYLRRIVKQDDMDGMNF